MTSSFRKFMTVLAMGFVATQFVNCSETSDDSGLYGNTCAATGTCSQSLTPTLTGAYLTPRSSQSRMECTNDHIQVGGACETDGAVDSYIEYQLKLNGNVVSWNPTTPGGSPVTVLREARCENGRFYMVVPRPPITVVNIASAGCTGECFQDYHLHSALFVLKKGAAQFEQAAVAPVLPIPIQKILIDGNSRVCPR